jgi:hypothetical protein
VLLFLDDERECPPGWTLARNADEAINLLAIHWDSVVAISLDHDLGVGYKTGYDLACKIEEMTYCGSRPLPRGIILNVHSANPVGAKRIGQALDSAAKMSGLHVEVTYHEAHKLRSLMRRVLAE